MLALAGIVLVTMVAVVSATVLSRRGGDPVDQTRPGPVVVVPGYAGTARDISPLVSHLRGEGRTVVAFEPTDGGRGDLRVQAGLLAELVRRTLERTGTESVDVIGYSAGGVIARLFVRDEDGTSVVRRVLTLGSPHHGTDVAALAEEAAGGCPTACEQLATGSELLQRLDAGDETPTGPRWITVRTERDRTVTPPDSAALDGALNVVVQEICPGSSTSHDGLPGDPVVLATLRSVLGAGAPTAPEDVTC